MHLERKRKGSVCTFVVFQFPNHNYYFSIKHKTTLSLTLFTLLNIIDISSIRKLFMYLVVFNVRIHISKIIAFFLFFKYILS